MISRKDLFAEISNEAITEDGEVVGYFVRNNRMNTLEQMLCSAVTVKLPGWFVKDGIAVYDRDETEESLTAAGIKWEAE